MARPRQPQGPRPLRPRPPRPVSSCPNCPVCGLGCNQGAGHGGDHTDREKHTW